jgi:predicted acylesterase/phospholipase RssA
LAEAGIVPGGFQFLSGTSAGAIICGGLAMFPATEFAEGAAYVKESWESLDRSSDVWRLRFPLGIPGLWHPSAGTDEPLKRLLEERIDPMRAATSGVELRLTAVDLLSGTLKVYKGADLVDHGVDPIRASAAFPAVFPPVEIGDRWEIDGGARDVTPLGEAIKAGCDRIVVFISQDPHVMPRKTPQELRSTIYTALRFVNITVHEIIMGDVRACEHRNRLIARGWVTAACPYKHIALDVIYPSAPLGDPLVFDRARIAREIAQGYEDTKLHFESK